MPPNPSAFPSTAGSSPRSQPGLSTAQRRLRAAVALLVLPALLALAWSLGGPGVGGRPAPLSPSISFLLNLALACASFWASAAVAYAVLRAMRWRSVWHYAAVMFAVASANLAAGAVLAAGPQPLAAWGTLAWQAAVSALPLAGAFAVLWWVAVRPPGRAV